MEKTTNANQIKPVTVRQLSIAGLVIIIFCLVIVILILKHKQSRDANKQDIPIPAVIKPKITASQAEYMPANPSMSFNLRTN